jgi:hypothetical protein
VTSHKVGKGILHWGMPLDQVLAQHGIQPDFAFTHTAGKPAGTTMYPNTDIEFIHRRAGSDEIYFLSNQHAEAKSITAKFRVTGKLPELWMPDSGTIYKLTDFKTTGEHTELPMRLGPEETCFVVFREASAATATEPVPWSREERTAADLDSGWTVAFPDGKSVELPKLVSWPELENEDARYHSGTAIYRKTLDWQGSSEGSRVFLDLGEVEVIARVLVNDKDCGIAWKKPYRVEVTDSLKPGGNTIEITVANLWVNRILGDQRLPDDLEWTTVTDSTAEGMGLTRIPDW